MEQEVLRTRNAVFKLIHLQSTAAYALYVPKSMQWCLEVILLVLASLLLGLWSYIHNTYIIEPVDCLDQFTSRPFPGDIILQVEVYTNSSFLWQQRLLELDALYEAYNSNNYSYENVPESSVNESDESTLVKEYCSSLLPNVTRAHFLCHALFDNFPDLLSSENSSDSNGGSNFYMNETVETSNDTQERLFEDDNIKFEARTIKRILSVNDSYSLYDLLDPYVLGKLSFDYTVMEFTQEPGYLSLTHSSRAKLNITTIKMYIDPDKSNCFGGSFGLFLTRYFLGYDMMIISSFKNLLPVGRETGYVKNLLSGNLYFYKVQWMGKWRYFAGVLPSLFFTLVASILSRQVHFNVFKFFNHIQLLLNQGIPMPVQIGAQVPFLIITYAAIGLIIVMSEVLHDDSMFCLLMIGTVWEADQFYAVYCRQKSSQLYFPWFFFLYHFLPYAYYIRFNGQFWFIPFLLHWIMLQHAMLYFIHRCEIPALNQNDQEIHRHHLQPQADIAEDEPVPDEGHQGQ